MDRQNRQEGDHERGQSSRQDSVEPDSVEWFDFFEVEPRRPQRDDSADDHHGHGQSAPGEVPQDPPAALSALKRASKLFVGLSDPFDDSLSAFVTELPQWFRHPGRIEATLRVGSDEFETDGFRSVMTPLTAKARTRTGTRVSMTVVCMDQVSSSGEEPWLESERELVETLVSLIRDGIDRWEIDSLKRVSDGVAVLDGELNYTYVNQQAEQLLGRASEEMRGRHVWDLFPEAADTVAEDRIQTAIETRSPTSFERYNAEKGQWFETRIHPSDDGIIVVFTDITDSKLAEQEFDHVLETTPIGIVLLDGDGNIVRANTHAEELLGLSRRNIEGKEYDHPDWDIWDEAGDPIPREDHPVSQVLRTGTTVKGFTHGITLPDGSERWLSSNVAPVRRENGSIEQIIVAMEDITVPKRLEQLIETFQPVDEILYSATADEETEQAICELLTETREYQSARIHQHTPGATLTESALQERSLAVATSESVTAPIQSPTETAPARVAVETGEIQVVTSKQSDSRFEGWRASTLDRGFQGGAIVPLTYRTRTYGLLVLYTDRGEAFGDREQSLLATLGNKVGQVLQNLATERILHADRVAELTFESTDTESFFVSASGKLGCTIDIRETIPTADDTVVHYASVRDAPLDALSDIATNADYTAQVRQIRHIEDPPGGDVEIELHRRSIAQTLVTEGAVVTADVVTDGRAEVVCEVPLSSDIGSLVTRVQDSFPDTTFVSKREYSPASEPDGHKVGSVLGDVFESELTDRQQQVLRAAVYSGYFNSPRRTTATEIADALSLTQSTVSYHLRHAERTLFEQLFDRLQR